MKKLLWLIALGCLLVTVASWQNLDLVRFTVVNASPFPLEIRLEGRMTESFYYLRLPKGDPEFPLVRTFTIARDQYQMQVYYIDLWDPVYGYTCHMGPGGSLNARKNNTITVRDCRASQPGGQRPGPHPTAPESLGRVEVQPVFYHNGLYWLY